MTRIAVELPEDIAEHLESAGRDVSRGTLEAVALEGYLDGALTRGQVAPTAWAVILYPEAFLRERQAYPTRLR